MNRITRKKIIISAILVFSSDLYAEERKALDCVITPSMSIELSSQVRGVLKTVNVKRGDVVSKGQLVAELMAGVETAGVRLAKERSEMNHDIKARRAEQKFRNNVYAQVKPLYEKKLASKRDYDDAKTLSMVANFEMKKAIKLKKLAALELWRTEEILKLRSMHSTVNGVVVEVMKSPGEYVEEQPVVRIAQIDPLYVEVIVPEELMDNIKLGIKAEVKVKIPNPASYIATVMVVDPVIDASSGTFGVRLEFPNPDYKIHAGQRCTVKLLDEAQN